MDYKQFKIERLDTISQSFCATKWLQSSFYLHIGTTSSCHYPTPHFIDLSLAEQDINRFNNTDQKIKQREQMLSGERPIDCNNCWNAENADENSLSERILDSYLCKEHDFTQFKADLNQVPAYISICFDSLCNFSCSYCDDTQSSTWESDLRVNGIYEGIIGDRKLTYQKIKKVDRVDDYDRIFNLFTKYVAHGIDKIEQITCIGGEPIISPNFWNFMDFIDGLDTRHITLVLNTNLSNITNLEKLLQRKHSFKEIKITASAENAGSKGEFIRKGFSWPVFQENINFILDNQIAVQINATLSGIALDGLCEFVEYVQGLPADKNVILWLNKLRHPNFQSMQTLPKDLRDMYADQLEKLEIKNYPRLAEQIKSIIYMLRNDYTTFDGVPIKILQHSARNFYKEYARRHNFDIRQIFSPRLADWLLS